MCLDEMETEIGYRIYYIHNWLLQPISQDNNVAFHTTFEWQDLHFKVDSK